MATAPPILVSPRYEERRRYKAKYPDKIRASHREYQRRKRTKNPEAVLEYQRNWRKKNRIKCAAYYRKYRLANKTQVNANYRKWKAANPGARIAHSLRTTIRDALKGTKLRASAIRLLGCSIDELKFHLARKFQLGMTMFNYGSVWHLDHIKPCSSFDLSDPRQQEICFHYSNLMPLFAMQNVIKGGA
jgi:hypothetical protein